MIPERRRSLADILVIVAGTLSLIVLGAFVFAGRGAALDNGLATAAVIWGLAVGVWWSSVRSRPGGTARFLARGALALVALPLCLAAAYRGRQLIRGDFAWPPPVRPLDEAIRRVSGDDALLWSVRIAAHALTSHDSALEAGIIPNAWPMPRNVEIRRVIRGDTLVISARRKQGTRVCAGRLVHDVFVAREVRTPITCRDTGSSEAMGGTLIQIASVEIAGARESAVPITTNVRWSQYRGSASRVAGDSLDGQAAAGWRTHVGGEVRSSVAIAAGIVVTGSHGTGALLAASVETGKVLWQATVPNWVHEDPIVVDDLVVVGFGDSGRSFYGRAPAGVAAYSLHDGHLIWTGFESNSVMTSPVAFENRVVYATAGGRLVSRDLQTGIRRAEVALPGAVQMAPPALIDSSVVLAADPNWVCVFDARTLARKWCSSAEDGASASGSAPAVVSGVVIQSMVRAVDATDPIGEIRRLGPSRYLSTIAGIIRGNSYRPGAQFVVGYDLATGQQRWRTPNFPATRVPRGHSSGTATRISGGVALLLPVPDEIVALDLSMGKLLWRQPGHAGRGPPLSVGNDLYVFAPDGTIRVIDGTDGRVRCSIATPASFDRAGPTKSGGLLIGGSIQGDLFAIPRSSLESCDNAAVRRLLSAPSE